MCCKISPKKKKTTSGEAQQQQKIEKQKNDEENLVFPMRLITTWFYAATNDVSRSQCQSKIQRSTIDERGPQKTESQRYLENTA